MANHTPPEQPVTRTVARWTATQQVAVSLALIISLVGIAVPYGASTPGVEFDLNAAEWVLSSLALLAAVGLALDLARPLRQRSRASGLAYLVAAGVWAAVAAYHLLIFVDITWTYAASEFLRCLGMAGLALYQWRRITLAPRLEVTTDE